MRLFDSRLAAATTGCTVQQSGHCGITSGCRIAGSDSLGQPSVRRAFASGCGTAPASALVPRPFAHRKLVGNLSWRHSENRYCLAHCAGFGTTMEGACPIPQADHGANGGLRTLRFFGKVVFTNGHLVDGDTLTVYYGASDSVICGARFSIQEILTTLH